MKALWNATLLAESDDIVIVEGNPYFPASTLNKQYIRPSATHTTCSWKGVASYYDVVVGDAVNPDAVWYYPEPKEPRRRSADASPSGRASRSSPSDVDDDVESSAARPAEGATTRSR